LDENELVERQQMIWTEEAKQAVSRVAFFVRKRVKRRVEEESLRQGAHEVTLKHVESCQRRFLQNMEEEVKGYQVESCFGPGGCPNRAVEGNELPKKVEELLARRNLKGFLKERVKGPLKMHHEFRVSISDCPNACSRPQIVDVGIIGARQPALSEKLCTRCGACLEVCQEEALQLWEDAVTPTIDLDRCVRCGKCLDVCPSGTLREGGKGYRLLVGGKLGRHPQLAEELQGICREEEVLVVLDRCLDLYLLHNRSGERFGEVLKRAGLESLYGEEATLR
jgi:anaerobic sulfite reductase subunit C